MSVRVRESRNGLIPERKARTRGYDWQQGRHWVFNVDTYAKVASLVRCTGAIICTGAIVCAIYRNIAIVLPLSAV